MTGYGSRTKGATVLKVSGKRRGFHAWQCRLCLAGGPPTTVVEAHKGAQAHNAEHHTKEA